MSGWGFLSKAEGFLDRVLEEQGTKKGSATASVAGQPPSRSTTPTARWQDRLSKAASQFASTESLSALNVQPAAAEQNQIVQAEDATNGVTTEASIDVSLLHTVPEPQKTELQLSRIFPANMPSYIEDTVSIAGPDALERETKPSIELSPVLDGTPTSNGAITLTTSAVPSTKPSVDLDRSNNRDSEEDMTASPKVVSIDTELVDRLKSDLATSEARRIEEAQVNAERISALERRLAYFSDDSLTKTREISQSGGSTSQQKLLAERDAKIALLLEEGDHLSKKELQHLTNMKKLRTRVTELESLISTSLKAVDKAESERLATQKETKEAQDSLKRAETKVRELSRMEEEVGDLKAESQVKSRIISDLKRQLADADETIKQGVTIFTQLQAEKAKTDSLQKRIGTLLTEAKVTAEENASDMAELQGRLDRLLERTRISDQEKASEMARLEGEIEILRAQLEETTTNASENSQAKMLRQIEGLQTQQSLARQNWARIEESLVMRSTHAEKERDELREQEDDLRNRLRQAVLLRKDVEEERSIAQGRVKTLESNMRESQEQIGSLMQQLEAIKKELDSERQNRVADKEMSAATFESRLQERLAEERHSLQVSTPHSPYMNDMMNRSGYSFQRHITDSPNASRTPDVKRPSLPSRAPTQNSRVPSRRKTSQYSFLEDMKSPPLRDDDPFDPDDSASQLRPHTEVSISTASAGASVGMMERVSANVRKLEMEMSILREDLSRMTRQRDEARTACVEMEQLEQERNQLQQTVAQAQAEKAKMKSKFETTLELLGEQTEENEQLKEDIIDMRKAFKESLSTVGLGA